MLEFCNVIYYIDIFLIIYIFSNLELISSEVIIENLRGLRWDYRAHVPYFVCFDKLNRSLVLDKNIHILLKYTKASEPR